MSSKPCRNQEMSWGKTVKPCINQTCNSGWFAISGQKSKISGHRQRGHSFFTEHLLTALGPEKARGDQRWSTGARLTNKYSFCIIVLWFWRNLNDLNEAMSFISMFQCVPWCSMMFHVFVPWLFPMFSRCFAAIKFGRFLQILTFLPEPDVFQKNAWPVRFWMLIQRWCYFWLVVRNMFFIFHIWDVILPIDELIYFSRWVKHGKTTNQIFTGEHTLW